MPVYHLSHTGDDGHDGLTPGSAWRTVTRLTKHFADKRHTPGDVYLFQSGPAFDGALGISMAVDVTLGSYAGRATLRGVADKPGIEYIGPGPVLLRDLDVIGPGVGANKTAGVVLTNAGGYDGPARRFETVNCRVSGWGRAGLAVVPGNHVIDGIMILNSDLTGNAVGAHIGYDPSKPAERRFRRVFVQGNRITHNKSPVPNLGMSGVGLNISNAFEVDVSHNYVAHNGGSNDFGNNGMLIEYSDHVRVHHNIACHHLDAAGPGAATGSGDGQGIVVNGLTEAQVYANYTYRNSANGILVMGEQKSAEHVEVFDNVSENDGSGITVGLCGHHSGYGPDIGVWDCKIYRNTIYARHDGQWRVCLCLSSFRGAVEFRANVCITEDDACHVQFDDVSLGTAGNSVLCRGNFYHARGGTADFCAMMGVEAHYTLADWGQDLAGHAINPQLTAPGQGGAQTDPYRLHLMTAYRPLPGSPVLE